MQNRTLKILIADDDNAYSVMLARAIINHGHSVVTCNSGEDAINNLQNHLFDVILLDFKMEGTNGINVLQWMYGKKVKTPVILITGHGAEDIYEEAFKWGAVEYFIKGEMDNIRLPLLVEQIYKKHNSPSTMEK